jgi:hypothetical protein
MSNDAEEQRQIDSEVQETRKIMDDFNDLEQRECNVFYGLEVSVREVIDNSKELMNTSRDLIRRCRDIVEYSKIRRMERERDYI